MRTFIRTSMFVSWMHFSTLHEFSNGNFLTINSDLDFRGTCSRALSDGILRYTKNVWWLTNTIYVLRTKELLLTSSLYSLSYAYSSFLIFFPSIAFFSYTLFSNFLLPRYMLVPCRRALNMYNKFQGLTMPQTFKFFFRFLD